MKKYNPTSPGQRFKTNLDFDNLTATKPLKKLARINPKRSGRNTHGRITVRHQGGRQKRLLRKIDWKRDKRDLKAIVTTIEYDPNRTANIALLTYPDGIKRYILAPFELKVGQQVATGPQAEPQPGNALPLANIPVGTIIHNIELTPGKGAQIARSAGTGGIIQGREPQHILIKLSSGEIRRFSPLCYATIGQLSNPDWKTVKFGKAGRKRLMGIRPGVRGTAQHPGSHPHGGGEGRSGIGMPSPKSPWGKKTLGKKTRKPRKYSQKLIVKDRRTK
jgi:large subunit ribosomal protein L2